MDRQQFDNLARALAEGSATRRNALRVLTGGALASVGMKSLAGVAEKAKGDRKVKKQGSGGQKARTCLPPGRTCLLKTKRGTASEKRACKLCCGSVTQLTGKQGRCCNHNGRLCGSTAQCCLGVCTNGTCQNDVIQLPPPPPAPCVALGQPCPAGCVPNGVCPECCAPGECTGAGVCGMFV
jgi:hypothetical protein